MAKKTKKTVHKGRILTSPSGHAYAVLGEDGKYWICEGGVKFRKALGYPVTEQEVADDADC